MSAPEKIRLHRQSQRLELHFGGETFHLSAEYLRVFSPSAEVKGHGPGQEVLQLDKAGVAITKIEPQGNYAIKLTFSDGHDSGIYTWDYLYTLGRDETQNWQDYLQRVETHNETEDVATVKWVEPKP